MATTAKTVYILGAGPAGISAAYFAQKKGLQVVLIEKKDLVGGKGASRKVDQYIFDFGPHAYHPKSEEINDMIFSHAGEDYLRSTVKMDLILKGKQMSYPFNFKEAAVKFNPFFSSKILFDYLLVKLRNFITPLPEKSFKDWGMKQFGKTLYDLCFGDYTERVWRVPASELSVELAKRKLPRFSLRSLLHDLCFGKGKLHSHIFTNELGYHREGIGSVYQKIVDGIVERGGVLIKGSYVDKLQVDHDGGTFSLDLKGQKDESVRCDYIISTIPLPDLLTALGHGDEKFMPLAGQLSFRHILLIYVVVEIPRFSAAHWTYLVDNRFHFHRISEQKNLSSLCSTPEQTVLTLEISCGEGDPMWDWEPEKFREMAARDLSFFGIKPSLLSKIYRAQLEDAYPIYSIHYEKAISKVLDALGGIPDLVTTGRQGLFLDIDMHDAMVLGKKSVDVLLQASQRDFYASNSGGFKARG